MLNIVQQITFHKVVRPQLIGEVGKFQIAYCQISSGAMCQKSWKSVDTWWIYCQTKKGDVFCPTVCIRERGSPCATERHQQARCWQVTSHSFLYPRHIGDVVHTWDRLDLLPRPTDKKCNICYERQLADTPLSAHCRVLRPTTGDQAANSDWFTTFPFAIWVRNRPRSDLTPRITTPWAETSL